MVETAIDKDIVTWDALADMVAELATKVRGEYDVMLAITRGGLVPAGMLAYRLGVRNILVAAVEYYDDEGNPGPKPTLLPWPPDPPPPGPPVPSGHDVGGTGGPTHAPP